MRCVRALALGCLLAGVPASAFAVGEPVLLHDTFEWEDPTTNRNRLLNSTRPQVADFFVVTGGDHILDAVEIGLFTSGVVDLIVRVWDDADGAPGSVLESWTMPILFPTPEHDVVLESLAQPTLLEGQTYWISVAVSGGSLSWRKADLNALNQPPDPPPLISPDLLAAVTSGIPAQWFPLQNEQFNLDGDPEPELELPGAFFGVAAVSAIPAPEPATLLAQAAALAAAGALARGRARARG